MRAVEKKRPPFMTPKRWLLLAIAALVTFGVWFGLYFREIQLPKWSEDRKAREAALNTGELTKVSELYKHVWETTTWIAEGEDEAGASRYVFITEEGEPLFIIEAEDTLEPDAVINKFKAANPDMKRADIIRVSPGLFQDAPVWEVYYRNKSDGVNRYYYQFYTFDRNVDLIETYKLPAKTGP